MTQAAGAGEGEDDLIATYFAPLAAGFAGALGLRDDCAMLTPPPGMDLVVKTDPIREGVHFFAGDAPADLAWKALAVNVSDLAGKGAEPLAYWLALALPSRPDPAWLAAFSAGLQAAQATFGCHLAGGDTDRADGGLSIGITAIGTVPHGQMIRRGGGVAGDRIFVSGSIGDAALGLALRAATAGTAATPAWAGDLTADERARLVRRYLRPAPRLALRAALRAHASAAMDVSDGLVKDFARLAAASGTGGRLRLADLPLGAEACRLVAAGRVDVAALATAGDDYEVLAAIPAARAAAFRGAAASSGVEVTEIGELAAGARLQVVGSDGVLLDVARTGYAHF